MTFDDYKEELLTDIRVCSQINDCLPGDYFLEDSLDKLVNMGELVDPVIKPIYKKCRNNRIMYFDAYAFDDSDKSVILISNSFSDNFDTNLTKTEIEDLKNKMLNFILECKENKLKNYFDITDEMLAIGTDIGKRLNIDYVDLNNDTSIDKIKLYIITNKALSNTVKTIDCDDFCNKKVELNIWSIQRFYDLYESGREKEAIVIDTKKYGIEGIPCIKAEMSDNLDYDAYLAIVPGDFLYKIYYEHGSRLLEGNVRAFLSVRGKINKKIRETIRKEPTKFFTYNNGIACTAESIVMSEDGHSIVQMVDLQIINGGQTTASLASAALKDKASLENIFVPMKLSVIKNEQYENMIQNISKYANSQNKVSDSDFFSNHAFHRVFETLSKKIPAPAQAGSINDTFWYYERSRGKYEQEQFKLVRKSEIDLFRKKYPKNQVIKKEQLAKYFTAAELKRPDIASKGAQKCMSQFASYIDERFEKNPEQFNEDFYKKCICYAIMYKTLDIMVNKADWYMVGGYKAFIVPYAISKIMSILPAGYTLDYDLIWKKQCLYPSLIAEFEKLSRITDNFLQDSHGMIVTEYCKRETTWKSFLEYKYNLSKEFLDDLINENLYKERAESKIKDLKLDKSIDIEKQIYELGSPYWRNLKSEGLKRNILSPTELDLLNIACSFDTNYPKMPSPKQCKFIWKIRKKLEDSGVIVD